MYYLAMIYMQKNDLEAAQRYIEPVVANAPEFQAATALQQEIYKRAQGGR
jgi:Tfp pilus assembly protein PilF